MNARDVMLWAFAGLVLAASIAIVLLGAGCQVYEPPCPCREVAAGNGGVRVQLFELAGDGGGG